MFSKKSRRTQSSYKMFWDDTKRKNDIKAPNNLNITYKKQVSSRNIDVDHNLILSSNISGIRNNGGLTWGPPTWYFLHTLTDKIKEEHLSKIRLNILKNIYAICTNLPCPECSQHAKTYLDNLNFNIIKTKDDFKNMIYTFHNSVNSKKGKPLFNRNDLDSTYENNVLTTTFYNFLIKFKDRHASNRFIHEDLYRSKLASSIVSWFKENQEYFYE